MRTKTSTSASYHKLFKNGTGWVTGSPKVPIFSCVAMYSIKFVWLKLREFINRSPTMTPTFFASKTRKIR